MKNDWNGKSKGQPWGYRFFIKVIQVFGVHFAYFFAIWVSLFYVFFATKERKALMQFFRVGMGYGIFKSFLSTVATFYNFATVIIDRFALRSSRKKEFRHTFTNMQNLVDMDKAGKGGILISGHVGNWENAADMLDHQLEHKTHVLMLDAEVEKIKEVISEHTEDNKFNVIPIKDDLSHVIAIHQALKKGELIALHADRVMNEDKVFELPFLNGTARFPSGPFIMAFKFKAPVTFVYASKGKNKTYHLSSTQPLIGGIDIESPEELAKFYVARLEEEVLKNPTQWFNFYKYFV